MAALGEALGLPSSAGPERVAQAALGLHTRARHLATEVVAAGLEQVIGPERLLAPDWWYATEAQVEAQLAEMFAMYMQELLGIIGVSTTFNQLTLPVARWRSPAADAVVTEAHVRSLWGRRGGAGGGGEALETSQAHLGEGFALLDGAVSPTLAVQARSELEALGAAGALTDHSTSTCNPGSRHLWLRCHSEEERRATPPALLELADFLTGLPAALEATALRVEASFPGSLSIPRLRVMPSLMAAKYGPGSFYVPHLDMYSSGSYGLMNSRLLTIICYLNPGWQPGDGGELCLFGSRPRSPSSQVPAGARLPTVMRIRADHSEATAATEHDPLQFADIAPVLGRVVMFRSRDVWHGIKELTYERWAVTVWLLADTT